MTRLKQVSEHPWYSLATGLLLTLLLPGCASTYTNPQLPENREAVLEVDLPLWILSIDGQKAHYTLTEDNWKGDIAPGPHRIKLMFRTIENKRKELYGFQYLMWVQLSGEAYRDLTINAKAGHTYTIISQYTDKRWRLIVIDSLTRRPNVPRKPGKIAANINTTKARAR